MILSHIELQKYRPKKESAWAIQTKKFSRMTAMQDNAKAEDNNSPKTA